MKKVFKKIKEWFNRYWLSELLSYSLAIGGWGFSFYLTNNYYISWIIVLILDNIWYYLPIVIKEFLWTYKINNFYNSKLFIKDLKNLSFEFWIPEITMNFFIYPPLIFYVPQKFDNYLVWIFVVMTITVILFYIQAITLYEIRKKYFK